MLDRDLFYKQLDAVYERRDLAAIEQFLLDTQQKLAQTRAEEYPACELCLTPEDKQNLNSGYLRDLLTVQNELMSFYRSTGRFDESLRISGTMKEEMRDLGLAGSEQYAIVLLNEGTAFRMMGDLDRALQNFNECADILENQADVDSYTLASLYNNRAPVYLQLGMLHRKKAATEEGAQGDNMQEYRKALDDLQHALDIVRGLGGRQQEEAITLCSVADTLHLLGDEEKGEQAADEALSLYGKAGWDSHAGAAYNAKAGFLYRRGEYAAAAQMFREAARITKTFSGENSDYKICIRNAKQAEKMEDKDEIQKY